MLRKIYNLLLDSLSRKTSQPFMVEGDSRTAIKSQEKPPEDATEEKEIPLTSAEQAIADRFDRLPGRCKRKLGRIKRQPESWLELAALCAEHEDEKHRHD